jgi:hypothetical protein
MKEALDHTDVSRIRRRLLRQLVRFREDPGTAADAPKPGRSMAIAIAPSALHRRLMALSPVELSVISGAQPVLVAGNGDGDVCRLESARTIAKRAEFVWTLGGGDPGGLKSARDDEELG